MCCLTKATFTLLGSLAVDSAYERKQMPHFHFLPLAIVVAKRKISISVRAHLRGTTTERLSQSEKSAECWLPGLCWVVLPVGRLVHVIWKLDTLNSSSPKSPLSLSILSRMEMKDGSDCQPCEGSDYKDTTPTTHRPTNNSNSRCEWLQCWCSWCLNGRGLS